MRTSATGRGRDHPARPSGDARDGGRGERELGRCLLVRRGGREQPDVGLAHSDTYAGIRMTCSFKLDAPRSGFVGIYAVDGEGMAETSQTPDWWKLGDDASVDCRKDLVALSTDGSFSSACADPWQGHRVAASGCTGGMTATISITVCCT